MTTLLPLFLFAQVLGGSAVTQQVELSAPDLAAYDKFGYSVAFDDSTIAIGAIGADDGGADSGSVYVYVRVGADWVLQQKLAPIELQAGDWFGFSVDLFGDTLIVGSPRDDDVGGNAGSVYVFERSGSDWALPAKFYASDPGSGAYFGLDVALTGDRMVVGANGDDELGGRAGAAYVFVRSAASAFGWREEAKLVASDGERLDDFGRAVCIEETRIVIGKQGDTTNGVSSGAAYVYDLIGSDWVEVAKLLPIDGDESDNFGRSVALSDDRVVVGSPTDDDAGDSSGSAYVFQRDDGVWSQVSKLLPIDGTPGAQFGTSVAILRERILVGASNDSQPTLGAGAVYEFIRGEATWLGVGKFTVADPGQLDSLGWNLGIGEQGFVSGAQNRDDVGPYAGVAYLFELRDLFVGYCHGDGGNQMGCSNCPCGNEILAGTQGGCQNSTSRGAELVASGVPFVSLDSMRVTLRGGPANSLGVLFSGSNSLPRAGLHPCFGLNSGVRSTSFDGLRCIGGAALRHGARSTDANGNIGLVTPAWGGGDSPLGGLLRQGGFVAGQKREFQIFYRDASDQVCLRGLNTSNAMSVTFGP